MVDISVIIPFCNELPQVAFTVQAMIEELDGLCKYEIILVDNMSHENITVKAGEREYPAFSRNYFYNGATGQRMNTWFFRKGIVKHYIYDEKQGHWNAKNHGIEKSSGEYLFFLDAHCVMKRDSMKYLWEFLRTTTEKVGGAHAYINYMLDSRCLEYRPERKTLGYQFCSHQNDIIQSNGRRIPKMKTKPYQVCVMSTCGMMIPRKVIEELGPWNKELGIYGGGESYMNWKQATCGYGQWIVPQAWCWHFADKRGYSWNYRDFVRNSFIAAYCIGGEEYLTEQADYRIKHKKGAPSVIEALVDDVREKCREDMEFIKSKQVVTFDEYMDYWEKHPGIWK